MLHAYITCRELPAGVLASSGLAICQHKTYLAASPDAVVEVGNRIVGVVEIKCPYSCRNASFLDRCRTAKSFCLEFVDNEYCFRRKHAYYYQIQFQMYVTGAKLADFVVWSASEFVVLGIARDDDFLSKVVPNPASLKKT